ncbi:NusA antitermination factor [Desulfonatronospira thiodismutans ASO3-1]|uniref:Transcription termination/antitermination protein NusA n=1 Tax=Desulfonatronospira thiodismutans ASO3-1 TaxID=555779 RepID=D6SK65_9BACT|nr:transcription termination factor NusA [Desulfonatronospira thiodismutans]EFI36268.1 NusA antitermination factor [Desulfonatronospira thiodismutans ASO3-1]
MSLELKKIIDQISKDKGIDRDMLVDTLEEAVRSSVYKKYGSNLDIEVNFNEDNGEIEVYQFKVVVDEIGDPNNEILLEDAKEHDPNVQLEDELGFTLDVKDLGRIAAQSAKQVLMQKMRDAEQEIIYEEYKDRIGEIISGIIQRRDRAGWIINLGRTEALLPRDEQIPKERFHRGDRVEAYIIDVRRESRTPQIIVSRSHPEYLISLFKREVPEISDGTIKIMNVVRDPGKRAKVGVMTKDMDVDPVGACVGVKGSRIHNIVQELKGERIDIVIWSPDIATYAANALSPARITRITVDEDEKSLEVVVPDDQLTPAIGQKGQNVKLASSLLGWKIDVYTESRYNEVYEHHQVMEQLASAAGISISEFNREGFDSLDSLVQSTDEELKQKLDLSDENLESLKGAINFLGPQKLNLTGEEPLLQEKKPEQNDQE